MASSRWRASRLAASLARKSVNASQAAPSSTWCANSPRACGIGAPPDRYSSGRRRYRGRTVRADSLHCSNGSGLSPPPVTSRPVASLTLEHLARRVPGQRVDEDDVLGHLEPGELAPAVLDQLVPGHRRVRPQGDERDGDLAPPVVRPPD